MHLLYRPLSAFILDTVFGFIVVFIGIFFLINALCSLINLLLACLSCSTIILYSSTSVSGFIFGNPVFLLELSNKLLILTQDRRQLVVHGFTPMMYSFSPLLLPLSFQTIPVHGVSFLYFKLSFMSTCVRILLSTFENKTILTLFFMDLKNSTNDLHHRESPERMKKGLILFEAQ